jgi:hypothetical protein
MTTRDDHIHNDHHDELHALIASACNAPLSTADAATLEQLLADNPAAVDLYLDQCELHTDLRFVLRTQSLDERVAEQIRAESEERAAVSDQPLDKGVEGSKGQRVEESKRKSLSPQRRDRKR